MNDPRPSSSVTLVVPCFNEAARIDIPAFTRALETQPALRLLFVDDGSTDDTFAVIGAFAGQFANRATILRLEQNRGKAEAVRQGLLRGLDADSSYLGFWDADLSTPLEALPEFIAVLDESLRVQWVIGSRVRLLGRRITRNPLRHYSGRVFATAASLVLKLPVYDTQCGAKLFRSDETLRQCLALPFRSRWIFDVELLARFLAITGADATAADDLVYELPLRQWRDVRGSKVGPAAYLRAAFELYGIHRASRRLRSAGSVARWEHHGPVDTTATTHDR